MTNKLRSVIEDAHVRLIHTANTEDSNFLHIYDVEKHTNEVVIEILDALIDEMEEDLRQIMCIKEPNKGYLFVLNRYIKDLKQAREELSSL